MAEKKFTVEYDEVGIFDFEWILCEQSASGKSYVIASFSCQQRAEQVAELLNKQEKFVGSDEEESE